MPEALLTIGQAAAVLNMPPSWQRDKVTARQVPHLRLGRHVRFGPEYLRQIMADGETRSGRRHRADRPPARPPAVARGAEL